MWQFIRSRILTVIIFIGAAHGLLVMGPKYIRANQNYTLTISNFYSNPSKLDMIVQLEGKTDNDLSVLNVTKMINVPCKSIQIINFTIPDNLSSGNYKITLDGQQGFNFHEEAELVYLSKSIMGVIQIDKPIIKPGDTAIFRVIVLDTELKPPVRVKFVNVIIQDPNDTVIRRWPAAELYAGVFESNLQIALTSLLGVWNISVQVEGEEIASKTFEVKKDVFSWFDVHIKPSVIPLEEHQALNLTIEAKYPFGKPVQGVAKVELYLEGDRLDLSKDINVNGSEQVVLVFNGGLELYNEQHDVRVKVVFVEQYTGRTVMKEQSISVHKYPYRLTIVKDSLQFRPGQHLNCTVLLTYHDGIPARNVSLLVEATGEGVEHEQTYFTQPDGSINVLLHPTLSTQEVYLIISEKKYDLLYMKKLHTVQPLTNITMKLQLRFPIKQNEPIMLLATCSERMTFLAYYVVSKSNIVDAGYIGQLQQKKIVFEISATEKMLPKATIYVTSAFENILIWDALEIDLRPLSNDLEIRVNKLKAKPGQEIELELKGRPSAYVGLAAYDKGLLAFANHLDPFWEDVTQLFDYSYEDDQTELDGFHGEGVFLKISGGFQLGNTLKVTKRTVKDVAPPLLYHASLQRNCVKSWLWRNVTVGSSGTLKLAEVFPESITSWTLTGFSIDPSYGLSIIRKPIELTTIQPFLIVDYLPYSIKREKEVLLQIALFNNFEQDHTVDVTLYNMKNEMEILGRPVTNQSYTKTVSVPPKVLFPVSFLVKAQKLGEMAVHVTASIANGLETDALEKVIRVMPESLVQPRMDRRFFCFDDYKNQTFLIYLDIIKKADNGSIKIEFRLNPNLLTMVIKNLDHLLALSVGTGEDNMVKFVPNVLVLDYLHAIGSKEQHLIDKAMNLVRQGYQNQMRYCQKDGSFGLWENTGGSTFLTTFVATTMQTASKYIVEIDAEIVDRALDWLASKQHSSGRFDEVGAVFHKDMKGGLRDGVALTSFVLTALLENNIAKVKYAEVIQKGMTYLSNQFGSINNAYDLSIATYAMMLNGHIMKEESLDKLINMSFIDADKNERFGNTTNPIETTAYALLSFVMAEKYTDGIPVMNWLVNQRYVTGSFPSTQDTFVGLKALTKMAEKISPSRNDYTVQLKYGKDSRIFRINSEDIDVMNYVDIPEDTRKININVRGVGFGLLEVIYQYDLNLVKFENRFKLDLEKQNIGSDKMILNVCASFIPMYLQSQSNMALIEVTLPSGYVVDRNPISEQTTVNPIKKIETRYGGTSVVVYYDNMDDKKHCFTVSAHRQQMPTLRRPAYVVVYDYYDTNINAIKMYQLEDLSACEISGEVDCSEVCKTKGQV
ncbi:thioester-containing protein 1 allele R1-like [Anopheles gambiae]|nr:thioester-containing protein 1 allele R1-like [Anopheles gambiae]